MNILFVCTGNTCRSPMAEGLFKKITKNSKIDFNIKSAGTSAFNGDPAAQNAVNACKKLGADISTHKSTNINDINLNDIDLFVVMTMAHANALMKMGVLKNKIYILNVSDPFGCDLTIYTETCEMINAQLEILLELIERNEG